MTTPYRFQLEDAVRIGKLGGRVLLANEMGTGKTFTALLWAKSHPAIRPIVVVCPASLKWNWEREAAMHVGMRAEVLEGTRPPPKGLPDAAELVVVNYDILRHWLEELIAMRPKAVIFDECHYAANRSAKRTKALRTLCRRVPHVLALSGTPLTNRPAELWSTLNILRPDLFPTWYVFAHRHCGAKRAPWGWEFKGATHMDELHATLTKYLMIRRRKADVLKELPAKTRGVVPLSLPPTDRREYDAARKDFLGWLLDKSPSNLPGASRAEGLTKLGYLKRLAGTLKLPGVIEWVENFLAESEGKLLLFAIHKVVIKAMRERFADTCVVIDGGTPPKERRLAVDQFQTRASTRLFIGNVKAAGVGLTLTAASDVAFAEISWVPGDHTQAEDRCHRIGTKKAVNAHYLVAKDTIEEKLVKIIQGKQAVLNAAIDGDGGGDEFDVFDRLVEELRKEGGDNGRHKRPARRAAR